MTEHPLHQVVELITKKALGNKEPDMPYVGLEHIAQDKGLLLGKGSSLDSVSANSVFEPDDILFGKLRPNLKKCVQVDFKGYCSTDILVLRPRPGVVSKFAAYVLQREDVFQEAVRTAEGTKMPRTSWARIKDFPVYMPSTQDEQRHIANILDTVDDAIRLTDALIAKHKQMKAGLLHHLLTRGIDKNGKLRDPLRLPEQFKDSPLGLIPKKWDVVRVEEAGNVQLGRQRSPKYQTGRFFAPYLRVANVFDGFIDYSDVLEMDFTPQERDIYGLLPGDILLNEGQSIELVGRSAIYEGLPNAYCFQNTLIRFRCNQTALPAYCRAVFKYWLDTGRFIPVAKQTTSVAHLGADRFAKMLFSRPEPIEQRDIAQRLDAQDTCIRLESKKRDKLIQLKRGLMRDLLTGRVRVNEQKLEAVAG
jgi:type I restriction enzyme S subunit